MAQSEDRRDKGFYIPTVEEVEEQDFGFGENGVDARDVLQFTDWVLGYMADRIALAMTEWNQQYQEIGKTRYLVRKVENESIVPSDGEGDWQLGVADQAGGDIV